MTDQEKEARMTASQMIHRAALASRRMTPEERLAAIRASEAVGDQIKARFANHRKVKKAPENQP